MSYISKIIASARVKKPSALKHTVDAKGNPKGKSHLSKHKAGHWGPDGHGDRSASGIIAKGINAGKQVVEDGKQVVKQAVEDGKQLVEDVKEKVDGAPTKFTKEALGKLPSGIGGKFGAIVDEKKKEAGLLQKRGKKKKGKGLKSACWKGYEAIGMKKKGGRKVPNCVPKKKKK
jgi:hypothetical protein